MCIEDELDKALFNSYERAGRETGYWANYFLRELRKKGGLATIKRMLKPSRKTTVAPGLQALMDAGRIDLSVEAVALDPRFRAIFTDTEIAEAQRRLESLPAYMHRRSTSPEKNFPSEVDDDAEFSEGAIRRVTVNAYERDPDARAACIAKHGLRCIVCNMDFEAYYGKIGRGFIHVHHKKPLAMRRGEYSLRPSIDLIPVCPNCHAMLHTQTPPLGIDELRDMMRRTANS